MISSLIFVFSEDDQNWVWEMFGLQPSENQESYTFALERKYGFKLLEQDRDFHKGSFLKEEYIAKGIKESRRMIVIYSKYVKLLLLIFLHNKCMTNCNCSCNWSDCPVW